MKKFRKSILIALSVILFSLIGANTYASGEKTNINTATIEQLSEIRGIGPATAQRILEYREENGTFSSVDEIVNVRGIGPKTLENIRDSITTGG